MGLVTLLLSTYYELLIIPTIAKVIILCMQVLAIYKQHTN